MFNSGFIKAQWFLSKNLDLWHPWSHRMQVCFVLVRIASVYTVHCKGIKAGACEYKNCSSVNSILSLKSYTKRTMMFAFFSAKMRRMLHHDIDLWSSKKRAGNPASRRICFCTNALDNKWQEVPGVGGTATNFRGCSWQLPKVPREYLEHITP